MGEAVGTMFAPACALIHPEVRDLWAYFEAGFHNLLVVAVEERYAKEGMKTALGLLGTGQLSLTKCVVLVDEDVDRARLAAPCSARSATTSIPPRTSCCLPGVPLDTLDFTRYSMNLGSKMVLDATGRGGVDPVRDARAARGGAGSSARGARRERARGRSTPRALRAIGSRIIAARASRERAARDPGRLRDAAGGSDAGAQVLERVLASGAAAPAKLVATS